MSDSEIEDLLKEFRKLRSAEDCLEKPKNSNMAMTNEQLKAIVESAVASALALQERSFDQKLLEVQKRLGGVNISTPEVETYRDAEIRISVLCSETLDIMKSLPDFEGKNETYVSWRKAAHTAYKVYEKYDGSSKHYQALGILRNKIKGSADMVLSSFDTPLNFKAIINRLDFTYADKRPVYLVEQEMSTLRQGNMTLLQYYDEVEKKLTLLINKTIMTYDNTVAASMNEKYRADALRVFISGTKKSLSDVLFSARPSDLPSALALAQEVEANHERYMFASSFARSTEEKLQRSEQRQQDRERNTITDSRSNLEGKNPHFNKKPRQPFRQDPVQPMDVDSSSRFRQPTQNQQSSLFHRQTQNNQWQTNQQNNQPNAYSNHGLAHKRPNNSSARYTGPKHQRINHLALNNDQPIENNDEYPTVAEEEVEDIDDDLVDYDEINFLGMTPCSRS